MNSKSIGADFVYAWSDAKIGMMEADMAVKIMYPGANADVLKEKAKEYRRITVRCLYSSKTWIC